MSVPRGTRGRFGRRSQPDRRFTPQQRAAAIARIEAGEPIKSVALDLGASYTTVHAWLRRHRLASGDE